MYIETSLEIKGFPMSAWLRWNILSFPKSFLNILYTNTISQFSWIAAPLLAFASKQCPRTSVWASQGSFQGDIKQRVSRWGGMQAAHHSYLLYFEGLLLAAMIWKCQTNRQQFPVLFWCEEDLSESASLCYSLLNVRPKVKYCMGNKCKRRRKILHNLPVLQVANKLTMDLIKSGCTRPQQTIQ